MSYAGSDPNRGAQPRTGALLLIIVSILAGTLTLWRYFTPLSGIEGTSGALLATFGCAMLVLAGGLLHRLQPGGARTLFLILSWVGSILTLIALLFLHGWWAAGLLGVGVVAVAVETFNPVRTRRAYA